MADDEEYGSSPGAEQEPPNGDRKPRLGNPDADPQRIHREYVQRRLGGGAPPTPEAYEDALEEWHRMPGAIRGPVGEVHPERMRSAVEERVIAEDEEAEPEGQPAGYDGPLPATDPGDNSPYENGGR